MDCTSTSDASHWAAQVQAARSGDDVARRRLLGALRPRLLAWARALTGDWDQAEDVTQDALVRTARELDRFRGTSFLAWAYRILANCHLDEARKAARRRGLGEARRHDIPRPAPLDGRDPADIVRTYLEALSGQQRAAFQLVDLEGWSGDDAAQALDVSPGTLRVHLHRARRTLRSHILENLP